MLYVFIWIICGFIAAAIYKNKGRSAGAAFIVGVLLGPIGIILVLLSSNDTAALERQQLATGQAKKCPHCGEMIRPEATICRFCQQPVEALVTASNVARIVSNRAGGFACSSCGGGLRSDAATCMQCQKPVFMPAATYIGIAPKDPPST